MRDTRWTRACTHHSDVLQFPRMPDDAAGIRLHDAGAHRCRWTDDGDSPDLRMPTPRTCSRAGCAGNMIASLDGGATDDGEAGGAGRAAGDRARFLRCMRHAADVILVGAATVRIENYSGAQLPVAARQERQRRGQARCRRSPSSPNPATSTRCLAVHPHRGAAADPDLPRGSSTTPPQARRRWPRSSTRPGRTPDSVDPATRAEDPGRPRAGPRAHRGRPAVPQLADRERPGR